MIFTFIFCFLCFAVGSWVFQSISDRAWKKGEAFFTLMAFVLLGLSSFWFGENKPLLSLICALSLLSMFLLQHMQYIRLKKWGEISLSDVIEKERSGNVIKIAFCVVVSFFSLVQYLWLKEEINEKEYREIFSYVSEHSTLSIKEKLNLAMLDSEITWQEAYDINAEIDRAKLVAFVKEEDKAISNWKRSLKSIAEE